MADYTASKALFAQQMVALAQQILRDAAAMDNLNACYSVHGFNNGGVNQFVDADFTTASGDSQLTAQIVQDVMFAVGTIVGTLTPGVRNSLRECIPGGSV